jgi:RNA polymerase-binding transcription factor
MPRTSSERQIEDVRQRRQVLREMLEDRRREILDKLRSIRETLPREISEVRDPEEQSVDDFVRDIDFALMEMKSETLARIDEALRALDEGTYGICASCGKEIAEARLKALPFATLCRDCQEEHEDRTAEGRQSRAQARPEFSPELG